MSTPTQQPSTSSNAESVLEFTEGASGQCPNVPRAMDRAGALFIIRMILSELDELACTVTANAEERDLLLEEAMKTRDPCKKFHYEPGAELIGAQFDALVDAWYYSLNHACKHGVNMSSIFDIVHGANMAKRDKTGVFLKRADGKIIKPEGWKEPDITGEIQRQSTQGAWRRQQD